MIWTLFITFFKIGLMSFGGGYAMIPVIQHEVETHRWMTSEQFVQAVGVAGMGPGPIAANSATLVGFEVMGFPGAVAATLGMVLPSLLVVVVLAAFFYKIHNHAWVRAAFYGLRPVVTALIVYAAIRVWSSGSGIGGLNWHTVATLCITGGALVGIMKYRLHPLTVIVLSGVLGIVFFQ